jgi:SAM-dependent methyltransferase
MLIILLQGKRNSRRNTLGKKDEKTKDQYLSEIKRELKKYLIRWEEEKYVKIDNPTEYWDSYWKNIISKEGIKGTFSYFEIIDKIVPILEKLQLKKILCVGNGISLEPLALAYIGFDVDVLDISKEAIDFISNYRLSSDDAKKFFLEDQHCIGGKINYIVGDFRDKSLCPGKYDVVITRRTLQYFTRDNFFGNLNTLIEKLNEGGIFINHTHNAYDVNFAIETYLNINGFYIHRSNSNSNFPSLDEKKKIAWLFGSSG